MLLTLHIQNYALIDSLEVEFSNGFIVLTGETGAGKSIILGALGLLLGERANISSIRNTEKKCIVEGTFNLNNYSLTSLFSEEDIDYDDITIIRRELSPNGKSRAFINDTPVNLTVLRRLTSRLIDIHSQHQNLEIEDEHFQFQLVDSLAQNKELYDSYAVALEQLQKLQREKELLLNTQQKQNTDLDYWKFQLEELKSANFTINEQEELEAENSFFSELENIQYALNQADSFLNEELSPINNLSKIASDFRKIKDSYPLATNFEERITSTAIELKDIAEEINKELEHLQSDPNRASYVSERLDTLYRLQQKHKKESVSELLELQNSLEEKIDGVENFALNLEEIDKKVLKQQEKVNQEAKVLSTSRKKIIPTIEKEIISQLQQLGMPYAQISIQLTDATSFRKYGKEHINILFSANKNSPLAQITDVASGGELSRLMLSIKQLMAKHLTLPTLLFDEIDIGVSGEIANKMGQMMQNMSQQMQVIAITHLPQVAAKATEHWLVYKQEKEEDTITTIEKLDTQKRIEALAKMLSGSQLTEEALANAKVLLADIKA